MEISNFESSISLRISSMSPIFESSDPYGSKILNQKCLEQPRWSGFSRGLWILRKCANHPISFWNLVALEVGHYDYPLVRTFPGWTSNMLPSCLRDFSTFTSGVNGIFWAHIFQNSALLGFPLTFLIPAGQNIPSDLCPTQPPTAPRAQPGPAGPGPTFRRGSVVETSEEHVHDVTIHGVTPQPR